MNRNLGDKIKGILDGGIQSVQKRKFKEPLNVWVPYLIKTVAGSFNGGYNLLRKTVVTNCKCLIFEDILTKSEQQQLDFHTW